MGESHLIHVSVDMQQLHLRGSRSNFEQFAVFVGLEQLGLCFQNGVEVNGWISWLAVAFSRKRESDDSEEKNDFVNH